MLQVTEWSVGLREIAVSAGFRCFGRALRSLAQLCGRPGPGHPRLASSLPRVVGPVGGIQPLIKFPSTRWTFAGLGRPGLQGPKSPLERSLDARNVSCVQAASSCLELPRVFRVPLVASPPRPWRRDLLRQAIGGQTPLSRTWRAVLGSMCSFPPSPGRFWGIWGIWAISGSILGNLGNLGGVGLGTGVGVGMNE